jgi:hypothetical protein
MSAGEAGYKIWSRVTKIASGSGINAGFVEADGMIRDPEDGITEEKACKVVEGGREENRLKYIFAQNGMWSIFVEFDG